MTAPTMSATAGGAHRSDEAAATTEHSTPASTATTNMQITRKSR
ncbi:hypothetical protein [Gordonia polyisoprenivorans]|nr:hypothetical protein [Gordonia polyisoprenivorans]